MRRKKNVTFVSNKWLKTKLLLANDPLRTYIPKSTKWSKRHLQSMLNEFTMVYIKPIHGTFGQGVMRVEKMGGEELTFYKYQHGTKAKTFRSIEALYRSIQMVKLKRPYMIQQGIELLKYRKRRFDIRVMVQRGPKGQWETTGIIGRLAHPKKIVTNYHNGGKPLPTRILFKPHLMTKSSITSYRQTLRKLGVDIAHVMHSKYTGIRSIGVDVGIDKNMKPWILEVNTKPDLYIFNTLKNKAIFRKIYRYANLKECSPLRRAK